MPPHVPGDAADCEHGPPVETRSRGQPSIPACGASDGLDRLETPSQRADSRPRPAPALRPDCAPSGRRSTPAGASSRTAPRAARPRAGARHRRPAASAMSARSLITTRVRVPRHRCASRGRQRQQTAPAPQVALANLDRSTASIASSSHDSSCGSPSASGPGVRAQLRAISHEDRCGWGRESGSPLERSAARRSCRGEIADAGDGRDHADARTAPRTNSFAIQSPSRAKRVPK